MTPLLSAAAWAISGTGTVGNGQLNVYVGVDAQRLERLHIQGADGADAEVIDVGEGISTLRGKIIGTLGMANGLDLEIGLPYEQVRANRSDAELCQSLGLEACRTSIGPGVISLNAKWRFLDEYAGPPISMSVALEGRIGMFTAEDRARITNRGEGTQDLGARLAISRINALGKGYYFVGAEGTYHYRFPNTRTYPNFRGDTVAPNSEIGGSLQAVIAPWTAFGFGPIADVLWRPGGLDFKELDLTDPDRLAALRVANLRLGGTVLFRTERNVSASLSVTHTIYAMNNPYVTTVSAGVSVQGPIWKPRS